MALDQMTVDATFSWQLSKDNSPFARTRQTDSLKFAPAVVVATYTEVLVAEYTIAAAANQDIDMRAFTDLAGAAVTAGKVIGFLFKGTGAATAKMQLAKGVSNTLTWFWGGTAPTITLTCSATSGCAVLVMDGAAATLDATHRTINVSNPGSTTLTLDVCVLVGP